MAEHKDYSLRLLDYELNTDPSVSDGAYRYYCFLVSLVQMNRDPGQLWSEHWSGDPSKQVIAQYEQELIDAGYIEHRDDGTIVLPDRGA